MKNITKLFLLFSTLFAFASQTRAATRTCTVSGNWSNTATWGGTGVPVAGDNVEIYDGRTLTVDIAGAVCTNINIGLLSGGGNSTLKFNNGTTLTSTGQTIFGWGGTTNGILDMSLGGTFTSGTWNVLMPASVFTPGIGTNAKVIFTGNFTLPNNAAFVDFNYLEIASGANTVTLSRAITIHRDFTLTNGTLAVGAGNWGITIKGDWTNAGGAFTEGSGTVTFNGTGTQTITHATTETFYNLTTNTTGPLTLAANTDVIVTNTLTMTAGLYNLNGRTLTLGTIPSGVGSTLTRAAGTWMYGGTFKRYWPEFTAISSTDASAYGLFPMGTPSASSYRPVEINTTVTPSFGTGATNSFFTVRHVDNTGVQNLTPYCNDAGTDIVRIHNAQFITSISAGGTKGGTYSIDVTMTGIPGVGNVSDIRLAKWATASTASVVGIHAAATGTTANPTAKRTGLNTVAMLTGDFRISTIDAGVTPLPVELLYLTPSCSPEGVEVILKWATAAETNNNYFTIDASPNPSEGGGLEWKEIGKIKGAGNSSTIQQYEFTYESPRLRGGKGWAFRLQQTDYDGKEEYFSPVAVRCNTSDIAIYPTISAGLFFISGDLTDVEVLVYSAIGEKIYSRHNVQQLTSNEMDISSHPNGVYFLKIKTEQRTTIQKLIIQK